MINHKPHASQNFPNSSGLWLLQTLALRHPVVLSIEDAAERRHLATAVRYSLVRVCHSPDAGRPTNRIRSHLKVAGWLASAFCKPFSTSLKPKNGLKTFGTNRETLVHQWKYQKMFRNPQPSHQKMVCRTLVQTIFKMSSDRGEACTKGGSDNRMSRARC